MINPKCNRCGEELNKFGAILLSPPDKKSRIKKYHICRDCYKILTERSGDVKR